MPSVSCMWFRVQLDENGTYCLTCVYFPDGYVWVKKIDLSVLMYGKLRYKFAERQLPSKTLRDLLPPESLNVSTYREINTRLVPLNQALNVLKKKIEPNDFILLHDLFFSRTVPVRLVTSCSTKRILSYPLFIVSSDSTLRTYLLDSILALWNGLNLDFRPPQTCGSKNEMPGHEIASMGDASNEICETIHEEMTAEIKHEEMIAEIKPEEMIPSTEIKEMIPSAEHEEMIPSTEIKHEEMITSAEHETPEIKQEEGMIDCEFAADEFDQVLRDLLEPRSNGTIFPICNKFTLANGKGWMVTWDAENALPTFTIL